MGRDMTMCGIGCEKIVCPCEVLKLVVSLIAGPRRHRDAKHDETRAIAIAHPGTGDVDQGREKTFARSGEQAFQAGAGCHRR